MYYTGVTNDLDVRLMQHQQGADSKAFTYKRRPVKLVFNEIFHDVNQAMLLKNKLKAGEEKKRKL